MKITKRLLEKNGFEFKQYPASVEFLRNDIVGFFQQESEQIDLENLKLKFTVLSVNDSSGCEYDLHMSSEIEDADRLSYLIFGLVGAYLDTES